MRWRLLTSVRLLLLADERIASATKSKEKGNALVAAKEYEKAQKKYDSVRDGIGRYDAKSGNPSHTSLDVRCHGCVLDGGHQGFVHVFFGKEELEVMPAEDKEKLNKIKVRAWC